MIRPIPHRLTLLGLLLLFITSATAQVGEQRHNLAIGVNGGLNMSSISLTPSIKQVSKKGINGGFTARYISEKYFKMICGAQVEVNFAQRGW